ncbi:hypothetical protein SAMN05414139_06683 [Burkholderia sp. D7]|nr:hypothetical protein SAMN05414139_06683 [Burkholderia sp. D7]
MRFVKLLLDGKSYRRFEYTVSLTVLFMTMT